MRLLSIRLENVRRFVEPVEIRDIGPGLNVLAAPNEQGKSTVFDALHALFFEPHTTQRRQVRALQPHAGGNPSVAVEVEVEGERYRIGKTWKFGRGEASVHRGATLLHQADAAEAWLQGVLRPPGDGGPAGLLWVRQGAVGLDPRDDATARARRDLATSVAGEIEAVTGGRQLEEVLRHCAEALARYETGGRGQPRKGGPLDTAIRTLEGLNAERDDLAGKARALRSAIDERARLRRERARLAAPAEAALRAERLAEAKAADQAAREHAGKLERAADRLAAATGEAEAAARRRDDLAARIAALAEAGESADLAERAEADAAAVRQAAAEALTEARTAHDTAERARDAAADRLKRALRAAGASAAEEKRRTLDTRIGKAEQAAAARVEATAAAAREIAARTLAHLETLAREHDIARRAHEGAAPALRLDALPGAAGRVTIDGAPMPDGTRLPVPDGATLEIEGIGRLTVHPGAAGARDRVEAAGRALADALEAAGQPDIAAARASDARRREAERAEAEAEGTLAHLAPDGLDALRLERAALPEPAAPDPDLPPLAEAEAGEQAARAALTPRAAALEAARQEERAAEARAVRAASAAGHARDALARARAALDGHADPAADLAALEAAAGEAEATRRAALLAHDALRENAPDAGAAAARLKRAEEAIRQAEAADRDIERRLIALDGEIRHAAGEAVDERLAETGEAIERAERQKAAVEHEIAVLKRLQSALSAAQAGARERYLAPIRRELDPLIRGVLPDARLALDAENILPEALERDGRREDLAILSGGTQEQIALLVRLAFARLMAREGRAAPVIFDDAIVFTDDDRIERMFDALTRQAEDLQILVFSCRQRAFMGLGDRQLRFVPAEAESATGA